MRERKYVKFRVDMFEDTKFKIIDRIPERDVIHYIWVRIVALAGKINLEGNLYMSKNIPYTVETLAIEFNRDANQIKLALNTFIKLEMVEVTEENIYKVKNFAKHQNSKIKSNDKEGETKKEGSDLKNEETKVNVNAENQKLENVDNSINEGNRNIEFIYADVSRDDNITGKVDNNLKYSYAYILKREKEQEGNK